MSDIALTVTIGRAINPMLEETIQANAVQFTNSNLERTSSGRYDPPITFTAGVSSPTTFPFKIGGRFPEVVLAVFAQEPFEILEIDFNDIKNIAGAALAKKEAAATAQMERLPVELRGIVGKFSREGLIEKNLVDMVKDVVARRKKS